MMNPDDHKLYQSMYLIRRFEETVLENFSGGVFSGTTHTYLGQEANAVGVLDHLLDGDIVVSNHRSHGHLLARGADLNPLMAEIMAKETGSSRPPSSSGSGASIPMSKKAPSSG